MKSFLLDKNNKPIIKWGMLEDNIFFTGSVPENFNLAVCPSNNQIILDVDVKNNKNGFNHIPSNIILELNNSFHYSTKSGGAHFWIKYTGDKILLNKSTPYGLDLRIAKKGNNNGGYVKYNHNIDIRDCEHLIQETSPELNQWLEKLFSYC